MKQRLMFFTLGLCLTGALLMPAAPPASAQLFGESDKDKAARLQREDDQEAAISQLSGRTQQLEDKVRSLTDSLSRATGANEELRHELQTTNQKMDRQEKDFAYRLCVISAQQLGADADSGLNCAAVGAPTNAGATNFSGGGGIAPGAPLPPINGGNNDGIQPGGFSNAPQANQPTQLGRPPGTLGTLPAGSAPAARPQGAMNTNSGAGASQFDRPVIPGDLLGGRHKLRAARLPGRGARLRRADQEISAKHARAGFHAQAGPVAAGDGPKQGRLHHPWRAQEQISQSLGVHPRRGNHGAQNRLPLISLRRLPM